MKFGDIIQQVDRGTLNAEHLKLLGDRYFEKFNNCFSKLFHNHFGQADDIRNVINNGNIDGRACCPILINKMNSLDNSNGWLFQKSLKLLNKTLGSNIESHIAIAGGGGATILTRPVTNVTNDLKDAYNQYYGIIPRQVRNNNIDNAFETKSTAPNTRRNSFESIF